MGNASVQSLDNCLPQTQCTRCTYPCCQDYASAVHTGAAQINQCPPGGEITIHKLASLTQQSLAPLNPEFGEYQPKTLAFIIEDQCIGCVLCIKACPVDAIVGANKRMHTVIAAHCTGCELCLPVCPTDCIDMLMQAEITGRTSDWPGYTTDDIQQSKARYEQRQTRLARQSNTQTSTAPDLASRQQAIADAVKRRKARKTA